MKEDIQFNQTKSPCEVTGLNVILPSNELSLGGGSFHLFLNLTNQISPPNMKVLVIRYINGFLRAVNPVLNIREKNLTPIKVNLPILWKDFQQRFSRTFFRHIRDVKSFRAFRRACREHFNFQCASLTSTPIIPYALFENAKKRLFCKGETENSLKTKDKLQHTKHFLQNTAQKIKVVWKNSFGDIALNAQISPRLNYS